MRVSLVDAMFSAFSAWLRLTGLAAVEIGLVFNMTGQLVMLALIQIGGLGIMTATSLIFMALGKPFSLSDRLTMQESLNEDKLQGVVRMTRSGHVSYLWLRTGGGGAAVHPLYPGIWMGQRHI